MNAAIKSALKNKPRDPVVPRSDSGPHSGVSLVKKLGLKPGSTISLIEAPDNIKSILGKLPDGATMVAHTRKACDFILWFVRCQRDLDRRIDAISRRVGDGNVWIVWPTKTTSLKSDLTSDIIRTTGLDHGLVDFKVCAVDETWSGLRFATRKR